MRRYHEKLINIRITNIDHHPILIRHETHEPQYIYGTVNQPINQLIKLLKTYDLHRTVMQG